MFSIVYEITYSSDFRFIPSFEFGVGRLLPASPRLSVFEKYAQGNHPLNQGNLQELKLRLKITRYHGIEVALTVELKQSAHKRSL